MSISEFILANGSPHQAHASHRYLEHHWAGVLLPQEYGEGQEKGETKIAAPAG